ncbi:MAG: translocation/assembly module TamB domain-containing protein [Paracoccaceae bacterium]|nr:MAG: translocation/assembly module TamB domain-containing protein [Paracoccaceae bacterium]
MRILSLILCLVFPLAALAQDDRGTLTRFLEDNLSGAGRQVIVEGFRGALSSRAQIDRLTIADDDGIWLSLTGIVLDWNRLAVLSGNIQISELSAREVELVRPPRPAPGAAVPSPEATPFALPDLPVAVDIGRIAADRIVLGEAVLGQRVEGTLEAAMNLSGGEGRARLRILRQDSGPEGTVDLDASYSNASGALVINLEAAEGPGGIAATLLGLPGTPDARLVVQGAGPLSAFGANVSLTTEGEDRLSGRITLREEVPGQRRFAADLGGDLAPLFLPDYAEFFGPEVRLVAEGAREASGRLDLSRLTVAARALTLDGSVVVAADGLPERFALAGRLGLPSGEPVLLPLAAEQRTRVAQADLSVTYDAARGEGWTARATVQGVDRADMAIAELALNASGRIARRAGQAAPPVFGATVQFTAAGLAPADPALAQALGDRVEGRAILSRQRGDDSLRIGELRLSAADYGLTARGMVSGLTAGFRIEGAAEAQARDLSRFAALAGRPLAGGARLTVHGAGSPLGGDFDLVADVAGTDLRIGQTEADNLLRGPSRVQVSVRRDTAGTVLRDLTVTAGPARLTATGTIATAGSDLTAQFDFPDLGVLGGDWRGGLAAEARLTGTEEDAALTLRGSSRDLRTGLAEADGLLRGQTSLDIRLDRRGDRIGIETANLTNAQGALRLTGHYDPAGSDLSAALSLADLRVLGARYAGALSADLRAAGTPEAGTLNLTGTGRGLAAGQAEADRLLRGDSALRLALRVDGRRLRVEEARLTNPQLSVEATGLAEGADRRIDLTARLANLGLILPEFPGPLTVAGTVREDAAGYDLDLRAQGPGQIAATARGRMAPDLGRADLRLAGSAQAALANAFLGSRAVSGSVSFDLGLNGPPALASLSGPVRWTGGRISDPDLPFALTDVGATATLSGGRMRLDAAAALTTGGRVTVAGGVGLSAPYPADLAIGLQSLRLRDPELFETTLDGALSLQGPVTAGGLLSGRINLRETELRVPSTGLGGTGDIPDLRHVAEPPLVRATRARAGHLGDGGGGGGVSGSGALRLDLTISAPNRVFIRGRGLDAELGGEVRVQGTTAAVVPSGALNLIRGRLDILGKRLTLSSARLDLQGGLIPTIEVLASNSSEGIVSFVRIEGPADAPEITFESVPELPQEEVLARLLFGRGLQNISALQAAQLASAVATLAGRGGDGIVGRLRKGFGLDDLDLTTDADGETSLRAGKYISERVYTEVEVHHGGQSRINLNLDLREGLTVKGRIGSDGEAGVGLFLEKDY